MPAAASPGRTAETRCPLCGIAAQPDGTCPDCGQDLAPLSYLQARPALLYNRALELVADDPARAARHLEAALAEDDTFVDAWTVLGKLRARAGRVDEARQAFGAALALRPDDDGARAALARLDARVTADTQADARAARRRVLAPAAVGLAAAGVATALVLSLAPARPAAPPQAGFLTVDVRGDVVELGGAVPDATARAATDAARAAPGGRRVVDTLVVDPATSVPPGLDGAAVARLVTALAGAGDGDVVLSVGLPEAGRTVLSGTVPDEQAHRAVVAALGTPPPDVVDDRLRVAAPEPAPPVPAAPAATGEAARLDAAVAAVQQVSPVLFPVGQVRLGPRGRATVAAVAGLLTDAGAVTVQVDGYAASSSGNEAAQAVSQQRATAVRDALVAAGVDPAKVTARGLAGANPRDNAQASRRVEISVRPA